MSELTCLFVGKRPQPSLFEPVSPVHRIHNKPERGGLWTCPDNARGASAWRAWDHAEGTRFTHRQWTWRLRAANPRIYTIDNYLHLALAIERWPHRPYPDIPVLDKIIGIDFAAMSDAYDAVHVTEHGESRTRLSWPLTLYGWDVETIYWLRWCFSSVEPIRRSLSSRTQRDRPSCGQEGRRERA